MVVDTSNTSQSPDRWNKIESLFHLTLGQDPGKRESFLQHACRKDMDLFNEVTRLLSLHDPSDNFLEPPQESLQGAALHQQQDHIIGKKFGSFRITHLISTGGMGTVWRAERADHDFDQQVAIKLMNIGMATDDRRRRFEQERQTLAQLEHPYITRLIDGGTTDDEQPYLVMEYVEGQRIDQYCDEHRLSIADRLKLFRDVCEVVHYAHQNLIIHRDLKPGNIFITHDGKPKLLDFGISKLLDDSPYFSQDQTQTSLRMMTPQYASPEQILGELVTTVSDVYSLGVVLYELLTGHSPYSLKTTSNYQQQLIICEQDPTLPSLIVKRKEEDGSGDSTMNMITPEFVSSLRGEQSHQLQRRLRGDLDNIVLRALQKEPQRRYNSVQQFSEDIQKYLTGMPVIARKDSFAYRMTKYVKRNKLFITTLIALTLTLSAGIIGTLSGIKQARTERDVAVKVTAFLQDILTSSNPYQEGHDTMILELLKDATRRIETEFLDQPAVAASLYHTISSVYGEMWLFSKAMPHAQKAVKLNRQIYGDSHISTLDSMILLGRAKYFCHIPESVDILQEVLSKTIELFGEEHPRIAEAKSLLANALFLAADPPKWEESGRLHQESINLYRQFAESHLMELTLALQRYSGMLGTQRIYDDHTTAIFEETLQLYRQQPDLHDRNRAEFMRSYSYFCKNNKRFEEEAEALEEFVSLTPGMFQNYNRIREALWRLVVLHTVFMQSDDAISFIRRALQRECLEFANGNKEESRLWEDFASSFENDIDIRQVMIIIEDMISSLTDHTHLETEFFHSIAKVARHACYIDHLEDADRLLKLSITTMQQRYPSQPHLSAFTIGVQGVCRMYQDQLDEAEPYLLESYRIAHVGYGLKHSITRLAIIRLTHLYERTENDEKKKIYQDMLDNLSTSPE